MAAVERRGLTANTLFIFTADNGFSPAAGLREIEATGHRPSLGWRGHKADIWEGGHRVPFFVRWPGVTAPGSRCDGLICLTDMLATVAEMHGADLADDASEDGVSFLHLLTGAAPTGDVRDTLVSHSVDGKFAIRRGHWKLAMCAGSGGWAAPNDADAEKDGLPPVQLYDLDTDPAETRNLAQERPEMVRELTELLTEHVTSGRSTPGAPQRNDGAQWWPQLTWMEKPGEG
jgi:arylsulfatase A-like enzyme